MPLNRLVACGVVMAIAVSCFLTFDNLQAGGGSAPEVVARKNIIERISPWWVTPGFRSALKDEDPAFVTRFAEWLEETQSYADWYDDPDKLKAARDALKGLGKGGEGVLSLWVELDEYHGNRPPEKSTFFLAPAACRSIAFVYSTTCTPCKNPPCRKLVEKYVEQDCTSWDFPQLTPYCR